MLKLSSAVLAATLVVLGSIRATPVGVSSDSPGDSRTTLALAPVLSRSLISPTVSKARPQSSPGDTLIAFGNSYAGDTQWVDIYNKTAGTTEWTLSGRNPAFSGNKQYVAGTRDAFDGRDYHDDIFLYDLSVPASVELPDLNTDFDEDYAALSLKGWLIAFQSNREGNGDIFLYDRGTSSLVPLPGLNTPDFAEYTPNMSPNARFIVFGSDRRGNGDVFLYDREIGDRQPLPALNDNLAFDGFPSVSRDGNLIAFHSSRSGNGDIYLYDRTTRKFVPVPGLNRIDVNGNPAHDTQPSISPDGSLIAFRSGRSVSGQARIYLYDRALAMRVPLPGIDFTFGQHGHRPSVRF